VAAALYAREKTGEGQHIKVAMLDVMIAYLWPEAMMQYTVVGQEASAMDPNARPDLIFQTLDGYMTVGTISDSEWQGFCRAAEKPDLIKDQRFSTPGARAVNAAERIHLMADILATRTTADWLARLDAADVPCAPVLRRGEVMSNEQVVARGLISEFDHPGIGRVRQPKPAAEFSATPTRPPSPAPRVGEHGRQILAELGYADVEIDRLEQGKVVRV
jgi:crotonobetainyl-CoA:carnitine CoA-transferase CaiB-like acyl-CoA transferase